MPSTSRGLGPWDSAKSKLANDATSALLTNSSASASNVGSASVEATNSNSSWAEMESQIIARFQMHPLNNQTKHIFALKLLAPLAEYQEVILKSVSLSFPVGIKLTVKINSSS